MIQRWYEVSCDLCGYGLNHYLFRPTPTDLRNDEIKVIIRNGKTLTYCQNCYENLKNKSGKIGHQ